MKKTYNIYCCAYARNILIANWLLNYNEPYIFPGSLKSGKIRRIPIRKTYNEDRFILYPNPAGSYVIVEYTLKSGPHPGSFILLYDNAGKIVKRIALQNTHDYLVVPLKGLPNGVYICKFIVGNKILEAQKLVVNQ